MGIQSQERLCVSSPSPDCLEFSSLGPSTRRVVKQAGQAFSNIAQLSGVPRTPVSNSGCDSEIPFRKLATLGHTSCGLL